MNVEFKERAEHLDKRFQRITNKHIDLIKAQLIYIDEQFAGEDTGPTSMKAHLNRAYFQLDFMENELTHINKELYHLATYSRK